MEAVRQYLTKHKAAPKRASNCNRDSPRPAFRGSGRILFSSVDCRVPTGASYVVMSLNIEDVCQLGAISEQQCIAIW